MPLHDWTRVPAGMYLDFRLAWIAAIRGQLNCGLLPDEFYADAERAGVPYLGDVPSPSAVGLPEVDEGGSRPGP